MVYYDTNKIKISICIPTYNRANYLTRCCDKIVSEVNKLSLEKYIEICISDNHSVDSTEEFSKKLICTNTNITIKYHKQPFNTGFSKNLFNVANMSSGQYVFFCGDDDEIIDDVMLDIYNAALSSDKLIVFNSLPISPITTKDCSEMHGAKYYRFQSTEQAIKCLGIFHMSFIGNFMVSRDGFLSNWQSAYEESAYPHLCTALSMAKKCQITFLDKKIVSVDDSQRSWRNNQPVYTAVDMARVYSDCLGKDTVQKSTLFTIYMKLVRSIPRAISYERSGIIIAQPQNPYFSLDLANLISCYRHSALAQTTAAILWFLSRITPKVILKYFVNKVSCQ